MEPKKYKRSGKRLIADIPEHVHHKIKALAAWKNITIRKYILQAILIQITQDEKAQ
jgi:hypothetical protein